MIIQLINKSKFKIASFPPSVMKLEEVNSVSFPQNIVRCRS